MNVNELALLVASGKRRWVDIALTTSPKGYVNSVYFAGADLYYDPGCGEPMEFIWPVSGCRVRVDQCCQYASRRHLVIVLLWSGASTVEWIDRIAGSRWSFSMNDLDQLVAGANSQQEAA